MSYNDAFLDGIVSKPADAEWTAEERKALPAALKRLDKVREEKSVRYEDLKRMQAEAGGAVLSAPTDYWQFVSSSLPKDYAYHKEMGGEFGPPDEHGRRPCAFRNRAEVERTIDHANAHGEGIAYPGRGGVNRYAD